MFTVFFILLVLQCTGVIDVSWWIVTISLWLPLASVLATACVLTLLGTSIIIWNKLIRLFIHLSYRVKYYLTKD